MFRFELSWFWLAFGSAVVLLIAGYLLIGVFRIIDQKAALEKENSALKRQLAELIDQPKPETKPPPPT